mgnify:CR=1 FL=1
MDRGIYVTLYQKGFKEQENLNCGRSSPLGAVSLPLSKYRKVAADFCSDQGARKEHSISYVTDEERRAEQKDQDLVCNGFSGNDTRRDEGAFFCREKSALFPRGSGETMR